MHALLGEFERHHERMIVRARERRAAVELTNLVDAGRVKTSVSEDDLLGKRLPRDEFVGDTNFRTLKALLKKVDERGFERVRAVRSSPLLSSRLTLPRASQSAHQLEFHENFFKASARVMYKDDWGVQKPRIMQKHGWESCPGEVLIRRGSPLRWCLCGPAPAPPTNTDGFGFAVPRDALARVAWPQFSNARSRHPSCFPTPPRVGDSFQHCDFLRLLPPHAKGRDCRVQANPAHTPVPGSHAALLTPDSVLGWQSGAPRLPQAVGAGHRVTRATPTASAMPPR